MRTLVIEKDRIWKQKTGFEALEWLFCDIQNIVNVLEMGLYEKRPRS